MRPFWTATLVGLGLILGAQAQAATLCVNPAGTGGCFADVQAAVDASVSSDEVDISPGTYAGDVVIPDKLRPERWVCLRGEPQRDRGPMSLAAPGVSWP